MCFSLLFFFKEGSPSFEYPRDLEASAKHGGPSIVLETIATHVNNGLSGAHLSPCRSRTVERVSRVLEAKRLSLGHSKRGESLGYSKQRESLGYLNQ